ncbi:MULTISPECIES: DUF1146 family protein [Paenibacillus]|uniref:DUF1146 family protein n=3 Tax=Paenibacillus TaxID=44249 RepID=A0ABU3RNB8_9BACL|nr:MULTISPECIES: DUF1146 family protein [Paenibacillus]MCY9660464.1 DUF1146 family protein [Paenibacillus anseongense]MDU0205653.1 DUF1146 family protein [Paenibacillus sp. PFR10]MEB4795075.1 DUF1146 family protein [Paenibacillus chondroitinus]MEC0268326.1 DUF1146 family protein [Paenibacillus anseongense]
MGEADKWNEAAKYASVMNMVDIVVYILCIGLAWWALQAFRFDVLLKNPKGAQAIMLQILLSIGLGHLVASFFIQYLGFSMGFGKMF